MCSAQNQLRTLLATGAIAIGTLVAVAIAAEAAELKVLSASALKPVLPELAESFRRESGHTVMLTFATAGEVEKRLVAGETVDLVVVTDIAADKLIGQGLVPQGARSIIARVGVGIGVREGAAKPDIGTTDALKQTLLSAKSVTYPDPARGGASGIHFNTVIERLGIAEPIRQKAVLGANPDFVCVAVAKGEVEMCVHQISEIMPVKGVTLVGPLPKDMQRVTTFAVAVSARAAEAEAARAFLAFVSRPDFKVAFAKAGLDYRVD
jgi:molybdate transport system substrate-binding protein